MSRRLLDSKEVITDEQAVTRSRCENRSSWNG